MTKSTDSNPQVAERKNNDSPAGFTEEGNNYTNGPSFDTHSHSEGGLRREDSAARKMKDPKSFTQNLFDTLSLRMVEWLPLRRSPDTVESDPDSLQKSRTAPALSSRPKGQHKENNVVTTRSSSIQERTSLPNISEKSASKTPKTPSSRTVDGQPATLELKLPNQRLKRLSFTELEPWRQPPRSSMEDKGRSDRKPARPISINAEPDLEEFISMPSPPALKQRPQKHPAKTTEANGINVQSQQRKQRRVSFDGSKVLNGAQCPETETLDQETQDAEGAVTPSPHGPKLAHEGKSRPCGSSETVETVTHLTSDIVEGLGQIIVESDDESQRWREELSSMEFLGSFDDSQWQSATSRQKHVFSFVAQAVFYALSSVRQVLQSFRKDSTGRTEGNLQTINSRLDVRQLQPSFQRLFDICPRDIVLQSLWIALEKLFVPPKEISSTVKLPSRRSSHNSSVSSSVPLPVSPRWEVESVSDDHVSDDNAAYVATVALFALVGSLPKVDKQTWHEILQMRSAGTVVPDAEMRKISSTDCQLIVGVTDRLEHELALRLVSRFVRALTARLAFHEILKTRRVYTHDSPKQWHRSVLDLILDNLSQHQSWITASSEKSGDEPLGPSAIIVEWLRTLLLREWDGMPEMARSSAAGGTVQILASMYKERNRLGLVPDDFHTPFLSERLDPMEMPVDWLNRLPSNNKTIHLLSYPFLFPPSALVTYFRAVNHSTMSKYYESAMTTTRHVTQTAFGSIQVNEEVYVLSRMKTSMSTYLVVVVSREHVLTDTLNQLWRREKRELMRPLKVQMGMDEGEEGVDHGGVQQEFFRVAMAEALSPSYGTFTTDSRTRMSWIQPCAMEPLYKFELLGLLMSLAVYNGLTLPVNFPTALYRKLLGLKVKHIDHIRDGWPDLANGLDRLLKWKEGDVGDVFMRTYEFSFEAFGYVHTVDMRKVGRDSIWPVPFETAPSMSNSPSRAEAAHDPGVSDSVVRGKVTSAEDDSMQRSPSAGKEREQKEKEEEEEDEADLVTNDNRHEFVKDYIFWLTDKSVRPQYEAFARGFYTCVDRTALSIFTPEALKSVMEGIQEIDIAELEHHARYEGGFGPKHRVIEDFWSVVRCFSPEKKAQLLEFVTASDRIPVNGISNIMFVIQKNGVGDAVSFFFFFFFWSACSIRVLYMSANEYGLLSL